MNNPLKNKTWPTCRIGNYMFAPNVLATVLVVLLLPLFIKLGCWQWSRAQENQQMINDFVARSQAAPVELAQITGSMGSWINRPVFISGQYQARPPLFLDNVVENHRIGYRVLAVFQPERSRQSVLVDRGFIPAPHKRQQLPMITTSTQHQTIAGYVTKPYQAALVLSTTATENQRLPTIDIAQLEKTLEQPLYPFVVTLRQSDIPGGVTHSLNPPDKVNMHKGYAFQWFTFAFVLLLIYIFVNLQRKS
jgi:surfeit locus 1 family protein